MGGSSERRLNAATLRAKSIFSGCRHALTESCALMMRINRKQSLRSTRRDPGVILGEQDLALAHHCGETLLVGARAFEEGFNREGGVDHGDEARAIHCFRSPKMKDGSGIIVDGELGLSGMRTVANASESRNLRACHHPKCRIFNSRGCRAGAAAPGCPDAKGRARS
jgi:hypothetical protein